jgi:hypothetical protein
VWNDPSPTGHADGSSWAPVSLLAPQLFASFGSLAPPTTSDVSKVIILEKTIFFGRTFFHFKQHVEVLDSVLVFWSRKMITTLHFKVNLIQFYRF